MTLSDVEHKDVIRNHFDSYAEKWSNRLDDYAYASRRDSVVRMARDVKYRAVLDVGCGSGDYVALLAGPDTDYVGMDISPGMINECRTKFPEQTFEVGDAVSTDFVDGRFDLVVCVAVLEYYRDANDIFVELRRLLSSSGEVVFCVQNGDNVSRPRDKKLLQSLGGIFALARRFRGKKIAQSQESKDSRVFHTRHSLDDMISIASAHGFELEDSDYSNCMVLPSFVDRGWGINKMISVLVGRMSLKSLGRRYGTSLICRFSKK